MRFSVRLYMGPLFMLLLASCDRALPPRPASSASNRETSEVSRQIRVNGIVEAVHAVKILVPIIQGQSGMFTLTRLIPNGEPVKEGDIVAEFDPVTQMDAERDAKAKYDDLGHQVEQKLAEVRANREKRTADLRQAQADLAKAEHELKIRQVIAEIDAVESEARAEGARVHLASLEKSQAARDRADTAALKILELQRDRQKVAMERARGNIEKMRLLAPQAGVAVHDLTYRAGALGHAQAGDQIYRGYPLVSIFDPAKMQVRCTVNEPDIEAIKRANQVVVRLDAFPELALPAHLVSASPIASSPLGSSVKSFAAVFQIDGTDRRVLPDLSASVLIGSGDNGGERL